MKTQEVRPVAPPVRRPPWGPMAVSLATALLALAPALAQAKVSSSTLLRVDPSLSRNTAGTTLAGVSLASDESSAGW